MPQTYLIRLVAAQPEVPHRKFSNLGSKEYTIIVDSGVDSWPD